MPIYQFIVYIYGTLDQRGSNYDFSSNSRNMIIIKLLQCEKICILATVEQIYQ